MGGLTLPYIPLGRENLRPHSNFQAMGPGELNFQISSLIGEYLKAYGESYAVFNDIVGVLECAKMELWRRKVGPYEQVKLEENGDVYE